MTQVFVSYKREDEARVGRLMRALERAGLELWWDRYLPGGESWRANIQTALDAARCVIVCWTPESVGPAGDFVRDEAAQAKARGVLVPVVLKPGTRPPLGFGEVQAVDLSGWDGDARDPRFLDLVAAARAKLQGRPVPPARRRAVLRVRRLTLGGLVSVAAAGLLAFAMNVMQVQNHACALPLGQPALSDACGALGLGNRPTRGERLAFERLRPGDCAALRAYRAAHEDSPLRAVADSRLNARRTTYVERWVPGQRRLALFAGGSTENEARARARSRAEQLCKSFAATTEFRFSGADTQGDFACEDGACGIHGEAICRLDERQVTRRDTCGGEP